MPNLAASFEQRVFAPEQMDDFSIRDERLERALHELTYTNRYLGGYRALRRVLGPLFRERSGETLRVIDLGAGLSDYAEQFLAWGRRHGVRVRVTAVDANPATVAYASSYLDDRLPPDRRGAVEVIEANALELPFSDRSFDVATASLFLHHFEDPAAVQLLQEMSRIASLGVVVNDLYRHVLAWTGLRLLGAVLPVSPMFRHDGPVSVRRAFRPGELAALARAAGLTDVRIRRHAFFRLTLSTLPGGAGER